MAKDITYLQVKQTAERILITGDQPTIDRVYELVGNLGTRRQIAAYLKQWREETSQRVQVDLTYSEDEKQDHVEDLVERRTEELKKSLSLVRATLESTADGVVMLDKQGNFVDWNEKFLMLGGFPKELVEKGSQDAAIQWLLGQIKHPEELVTLMQRVAANPQEQGNMGDVHFKDGRIYERYSQPHFIDGEMVGRVWSFHDVTEQKKAEGELRLRQRAIEASTHGVIITENTPEQKIIYANPALARITGYEIEEVLGQPLNFLQINPNPVHNRSESVKIEMSEQREEHIVLRSYKKGGSVFWNEMNIAPVPNEEGEVSHFAVIVNDITERKAMEEQLLHQATHDVLTGLPNRALLNDRITQSLIYIKRAKAMAALLFLDLDRFKTINDSLGHKMGDQLLCEVARRLKRCVRETDTVARIGGDEFVVVLSPLRSHEDSISIAQNIMVEIRKPFSIEERELHITTSIGITRCPQDGHDPDTIIRNADTAMYRAKDAGRDNFKFFTKEMNFTVSHRLALENNIRRAMKNDEFILNYQPITLLASGRIVGVEALIRWPHPELGFISPVEFIPVAEEIGMIIPIGERVLELACTQGKAWQDAGLPPIEISVNVSGRQLKQVNLAELLARILKKTHFDAKYLVIELTENILMDYCDETISKLNALKRLGVQLAIDDFGTGYSSLSYLKQLPVDKLKIDQTFITDLLAEPDDAAITLAIIAMAKSLHLKVVAEGAETSSVMDFLKQHQCDQAQGYYFSKPLDAKTCERLMRENFGLL